jgi:uncharacterized membrane protein
MKTFDVQLSHQRLSAVFWLLVATGLCIAILAVTMLYNRNFGWLFLLWNLFLAWIPLGCALLAERTRGFMAVACGAVWLLFFPNAPYILTDLVHLGDYNGWMFWWVNLIMILSFAMTGLLLGYLSLYIIQKRIAQRFGGLAGWAFAIAMLGLCGFGIYLGRFERWNSWDVFFEPVSLLRDIWYVIRHPIGNWQVYAVSALLSSFLVVMYVALYHFARPHETARERRLHVQVTEQ